MRFTSSHIHKKLALLDIYMEKVLKDITKFNKYERELRLNVKAGGFKIYLQL